MSKWTLLLSLRDNDNDVSDLARKNDGLMSRLYNFMCARHWLFPEFEFSPTQNNQSGILQGSLRTYVIRKDAFSVISI